jgi:PAS domain S-box-containing protein
MLIEESTFMDLRKLGRAALMVLPCHMEPRVHPYFIRVLREELDRRKNKNPRYSLRAFAKFLGVHPSAMSRLLNGKQELSLQACVTILKRLALPVDQSRAFIASVSTDKRNRALSLLTSAIEPDFAKRLDEIDPRFEKISAQQPHRLRDGKNVLSLTTEFNSVMDLEGRFLDANEALARELDTIPSDLIGLTWAETKMPQNLTEQLERQQLETVAAGKSSRFEFTIGNGKDQRNMERTIVPIFGRDGEFKAYASSIKDITWHRYQLRSVEKIQSSDDLITVLGSTARVTVPKLADISLLFLANERKLMLKEAFGTAIEPEHILNLAEKIADNILKMTKSAEVFKTGIAASGEFALTGEPAFPPDLSWFHSEPIKCGDENLGVLLLLRPKPDENLTLEIEASARVLGEAAGRAIHIAAKHAK